MCAQVLCLQLACFKELIHIGHVVYRTHNLPWFRTLSWAFLFTSNYFFFGESLIGRFRILLAKESIFTLQPHWEECSQLLSWVESRYPGVPSYDQNKPVRLAIHITGGVSMKGKYDGCVCMTVSFTIAFSVYLWSHVDLTHLLETEEARSYLSDRTHQDLGNLGASVIRFKERGE
ncbi:hypothetical protein ACTXT7_016787 [Hymenolepis weldensis]